MSSPRKPGLLRVRRLALFADPLLHTFIAFFRFRWLARPAVPPKFVVGVDNRAPFACIFKNHFRTEVFSANTPSPLPSRLQSETLSALKMYVITSFVVLVLFLSL